VTARATSLRFIAGLGLLAVLATVGLATSAQAVDNGTLGIHPATESDFFHLSAAPGTRLNEVAVVNNHTAAPVTLLTYVVDGLTTPQGAFALDSQDSQPVSIGLWSSLSTTRITVPANSEVEVPITITVPEDATPGDYVGGIIIQEQLKTGEVSSAADGTPVRLDVIRRQGVRIYLNVAGDRVTTLDAGDLVWSQSGDKVTVSVPITNRGNTTLHPTARLELSSLLGATSAIDFDAPESLTPGATMTLSAEVGSVPLIQIGALAATVSSEAPTVSSSTPFVSIPWLLLLGVLAALIAAVVFLRRLIHFVRKARIAIAHVEQRQQAGSVTGPNE
jgi:hypothetical protein